MEAGRRMSESSKPEGAECGLHFEEFGAVNAATVVFLHGGGAAGWMWKHQIREFGRDCHVLIPDLPGQGRSTGCGAYSTVYAADCIAGLIRTHAHARKAHIVGVSEGAQVTVALLARNPELVNRAVVSSALLRPMPGGRMYTKNLFRASYRWFMAPFKENDWWIRLNMKYSAGIPDEFFPEFKRGFQELTESGIADMMYSGLNFRLPPDLRKAHVPVLVAAGKHEYPAMRRSALDLIELLPNARGVYISTGRGSSLRTEHNWALTVPETFNAAVRAWLEDGPLPDALEPMVPAEAEKDRNSSPNSIS